MDGEPTIVVNKNYENAPDDLVVLTNNPETLTSKQQEEILSVDWYIPDRNTYSNKDDVIFVRWEHLKSILKTDPEAPADHGFDPLVTVEFVEKNLRRINKSKFQTT
jgi:hypothetical protein